MTAPAHHQRSQAAALRLALGPGFTAVGPTEQLLAKALKPCAAAGTTPARH